MMSLALNNWAQIFWNALSDSADQFLTGKGDERCRKNQGGVFYLCQIRNVKLIVWGQASNIYDYVRDCRKWKLSPSKHST